MSWWPVLLLMGLPLVAMLAIICLWERREEIDRANQAWGEFVDVFLRESGLRALCEQILNALARRR